MDGERPSNSGTGSSKAIAFLLVEGLASLGTAMAVFALEVWIYKTTGSYSLFAVVALLGALPSVLISPLAGPVLDRLPRGGVLLACSFAAIGLSLTCAVYLSQNRFTVGAAGALVLGLAVVQTLRWPTLLSTVSTLAAASDIERVTAYEESVEAAIAVAAPILGVWVLSHHGIEAATGLIALTYLASVAGVYYLKLPRFQSATQLKQVFNSYAQNFKHEVGFGFHWIQQRRHMFRLLVFVCVLNFGASIFVTMQSPLALTMFDTAQVAMIASCGGAGLGLGALFVAFFGGPRPPIRAVYLGTLGIIAGIGLYGTASTLVQCAAGVFLFTFFHPMVNTAMQLLWRKEVPVQNQGAIFSIRRMFTSALGPLGIATSIPLSEHVIGPAARAVASWVPVTRIWPMPTTLPLGATLLVISIAMATMVLVFKRRRFLDASTASAPVGN